MAGLIRSTLALVAPPLLFAAAMVPLLASDAPAAPQADAGDAGTSKDALHTDVLLLPKEAGFPSDAKGDAKPLPKKDAGPSLPDARPIAPDPTPLAADAIYVLTMRYEKGAVSIEKVKRQKLPQKAVLPRHLGRFAAELYSGPTLVERLRFDFPLISDDSNIGESYAKGLSVSVEVKIPDSDRPNRLEIWDRATDRRWVYVYPLTLTP